MQRMSIFLLIALLLGGALLYARFQAHERDFGGIGRYRDRGDNTAAWAPYTNLDAPRPSDFLRAFCHGACPDSTYARKLLPDDNLRHVFLSFRDPATASPGSPVELYAKALYQETGLPYPQRLTDTTTLAGLLIVFNELEGPALRERAHRDSTDSVRKVRSSWSGDYREGTVRDSLDRIAQASRDRIAEQRRRDSIFEHGWNAAAPADGEDAEQ